MNFCGSAQRRTSLRQTSVVLLPVFCDHALRHKVQRECDKEQRESQRKDSKHVKWQNGVQNHQNGEPLPVLDPQIEEYDPVELYQWEMCVQFLLQ